jgi:multiple sugar transport system permease protein
MMDNRRSTRLLLYAGLGILALWAVLPYYWVVRATFLDSLTAVQPDTPIISLPFLTEAFTLEPWSDVWSRYDFPLYFRNSIIVSVGGTLIALVLAIPGAYGFARVDFPGRQKLFYLMVFTVMFPGIILTVPVFGIFYELNLVNTLEGVIIAISIFVLPQIIWLLQGFFRQGIPANIEEAAMIDGTTELGAFFRVVLPLSAPAVAATALFAFLAGWNNFFWVFILTNDEKLRTATVAIHFIMAGDVLRDWSALLAAVMMIVVPPIVFYGVAQRYVGQGLEGL